MCAKYVKDLQHDCSLEANSIWSFFFNFIHILHDSRKFMAWIINLILYIVMLHEDYPYFKLELFLCTCVVDNESHFSPPFSSNDLIRVCM